MGQRRQYKKTSGRGRSYVFAIITCSAELWFIIESTAIISNTLYRLFVFQEMLDAAYVKYESNGEVLVQ